jgi:hypothetical protein
VVTPTGEEGVGSLQVRGASLCLGTITDDIGEIAPLRRRANCGSKTAF